MTDDKTLDELEMAAMCPHGFLAGCTRCGDELAAGYKTKHKQEIHDERGKLHKMILREVIAEVKPLDLIEVLIEVWGEKEAMEFPYSFEFYKWLKNPLGENDAPVHICSGCEKKAPCAEDVKKKLDGATVEVVDFSEDEQNEK